MGPRLGIVLAGPLALLTVALSPAGASEGVEKSGEFSRRPVAEFNDVPGPAVLSKDSVVLAGARKDEDFTGEKFLVRRFALDGVEDKKFGENANTPAYLPRGGRRFGHYFSDLAAKLDTAAGRSTKNHPNRLLPTGDGGWLVAGGVGGDDCKVLPALLKLKADGSADGDFGTKGRTVLPARGRTAGVTATAQLGEKKKALWLGLPTPRGFALVRLDGAGAPDTKYGDDGYAFVLEPDDLMFVPQALFGGDDGAVTVAGCVSNRGGKWLAMARVGADGKLDRDGFGTKGWLRLAQTRCEAWTSPPKNVGGTNRYLFSADAKIVATGGDKPGFVLAVDGEDASGDVVDPIFGAKSLDWRRNVAGLVRVTADGAVDEKFGDKGVVPIVGPSKVPTAAAAIALGKDGELWVALVFRGKDGSSLALRRFDAKGKPLKWGPTTARSKAKLDGDFLVFPEESGRDLHVRAMRVEGGEAVLFGYSAPRDVREGDPLQWKVWQVKE